MSLKSIRLWFRLFVANDLPIIIVLFIWLAINILLFIGNFFNIHDSLKYFYLRSLISDALSVARAAALCLSFNCFLILLPVCRNLLSLIRIILPHCIAKTRFRRVTKRLFDQNIGFHRCVGYAICFWSIIHVGAHVYNYERLIDVNNEYQSLPSALNLLYLQSSSTALIRRSFYEIFWFAHHFFILFFICLIIHGLQRIIKSQTNVSEHNPEICASLYLEWGVNEQCLVYPRFSGSEATSWMWLCGPLGLYVLERVLRFIRSLQRVEILDIIRHDSNVTEIRFRKQFMQTPQPGQYIYLKCFSIALFEWHPFTVTSAAEDTYVSVHVRTAGNWTSDLVKKLAMYPQQIPRLGVDGPYGSAADDVFNYDGVILVGAGIGVTPYAAILKHIRSSQSNDVRLRRVYFYWICNTTSCYEWFAEMLQQIEHDFRDRPNFLTYHIYLTKWSMREARAVVQNNSDQRDIWTGLESKTSYGRPNFAADFQGIINEDWQMTQKREIGVFVCGPKPLAKELQCLCIKLNDHSSPNKLQFYLNKENF
ncbi:unnamed protein product [Rotaria socialis]|uniref:FAD-binding FR-type domain-containing protein n=1 Tax=Rotaria socialis TaxID=392032 RepID=A0A821R0P1_9BILA|nr:unnamed protein product [Rotaria socialis]